MEIKDSLLELPIGNIARVNSHVVRGETLWRSENYKYLRAAEEAGVDVIIDLRPLHPFELIAGMSLKVPFEYICFPIDDHIISDKELLDKLPLLFDRLDNRCCYICCKDGLQRADLALALYFMLHNPKHVPALIGQRENGYPRPYDFIRRVNRLYRSLTPDHIKNMGLSNLTEREFQRRLELLLNENQKKPSVEPSTTSYRTGNTLPPIQSNELISDHKTEYHEKYKKRTFAEYSPDSEKQIAEEAAKECRELSPNNLIIHKIQDDFEFYSSKTKEELYTELTRARYDWHPYKRNKDIGNNMEVMSELIGQYRRERFLINHEDRTAYVLQDRNLTLRFLTEEDVDWTSVERLPHNKNAYEFSAYYPIFHIGTFEDGVATVKWTIFPDGMYFKDEDGFGMEDNEESALYGKIDRQGRVVEKFHARPQQP